MEVWVEQGEVRELRPGEPYVVRPAGIAANPPVRWEVLFPLRLPDGRYRHVAARWWFDGRAALLVEVTPDEEQLVWRGQREARSGGVHALRFYD